MASRWVQGMNFSYSYVLYYVHAMNLDKMYLPMRPMGYRYFKLFPNKNKYINIIIIIYHTNNRYTPGLIKHKITVAINTTLSGH